MSQSARHIATAEYVCCPVCNGGGWVWEALYTGLPTTTTCPCRSCLGCGYLRVER